MRSGTAVMVVLLVCSVPCISDVIPRKCFREKPEVFPKRYLYLDGQTLDIRLEGSDRVSQTLTNHITKILLEEVLGYANVTIVNGTNPINPLTAINRILGCKPRRREGRCQPSQAMLVPDAMVNLEAWLSSGFGPVLDSYVKSKRLIDWGALGPSGRFGWFALTTVVERLWANYGFIVDHWRALQMEAVAKRFDLNIMDEPELLKYVKRKVDICRKGPYLCNEYGILLSPNCTGSSPCATLLVGHSDTGAAIVAEQVYQLQLRVNVAWVGSNLEAIVNSRSLAGEATLFFTMQPSTLTSKANFTRIAFPYCESVLLSSHSEYCDFEVHQLSKVGWPAIQAHTPQAAHLFQHLTFTKYQYQQLLQNYDSRQNFWHTACRWLKQNRAIWEAWIPTNLENKTKIYLGGMFPISGPSWKQPGIVPAVHMGLDAVNSNTKILPNHELAVLVHDSQCQPDIVMKIFIRYITNTTHKIAGIIGPGCSDTVEPIAGVAKHFNTVIISYSAEGGLLDRENYPYFFRTLPFNSVYSYVYLKLFKRLGWRQMAALTEDGNKYPEYISLLATVMRKNGINLVLNGKFPRTKGKANMSTLLDTVKQKNARIIIGDFPEYAARAIMCEAFKKKMTGHDGYVWFLPRWYVTRWFDTDLYNNIEGGLRENVKCNTTEILYAMEGHLSLTPAFFDEDSTTVAGQMTVKQFKEKYQKLLDAEDKDFGNYAGMAYDTVWVYAFALHKLLNHDPSSLESITSANTIKKYMQFLEETNFQGVSGHVMFNGPSRVGKIQVLQNWKNSSELIGTYQMDKGEKQNGTLELNESNIVWLTPDGTVPTDGIPEGEVCSIEGFRAVLGVSCDVAILIANILGIGSLALVMCAVFFVLKKRYEKQVLATQNRMKELGLMSPDMLALDEWEMPRDHVVINRKIGEGAFGTVYGGEAYFDHIGWVGVAVKTLKIGSTAEEKLDFLSEAEMMKRFDHKNIVQLLGVCTRGEPAYMILELMLYGDLKKYLLARRHLVDNPHSDEAADISYRRLTQMALNVACGLSYLANIKYVHRDVACRNCLVNAGRAVKIADFGMCRPMFDSDYYRFNRRGMLPVRWMAPESLHDGLFTPASDVWSYGVYLWELVTFCSFPYQGFSNNEVLQYVKEGGCLDVPNGVDLPMAKLMRACWERDPKDRITAMEIVEILGTNPEMVKPYLDQPLAAVEIEGTDSLEMQLPERQDKVPPMSNFHGFPGLGPFVRSFSMSVPQRLRNQKTEHHGTMDNLHLRTLSTGQDGRPAHSCDESDPLREPESDKSAFDHHKLGTVRERLDSDYWSVTSKERNTNV